MADFPPRFYQIILPPNDCKTKLRIPSDFAGKYGCELSDVVELTDPRGGMWRVRLEKIGDLLWLRDGWEKFASDHLISYGYLLTFKYKGNSTFNVHIFDLTTTEVDYPRHDQESDDESVQILDSFPVQSNQGKACNVSALDNLEPSSSNELQLTSVVESPEEAVDTTAAEYLLESPSFNVVFKKAPTSSLYVPVRISKHLPDSGNIELVDCDGKKWAVRISQRKRCTSIQKYLGAGWTTFVKAKNLRIGDMCVLKLIENDKQALKVSTIYKTSRD